jgi:uncharacterized ion transporter superfamily protein YfcC
MPRISRKLSNTQPLLICRVVRAFLTASAVIIIIGPTFALYFNYTPLVAINTYGHLAFIFTFTLSLQTGSRNHGILAAIAE